MAEKVDYAALKKGGFMRQKQKGCFSLRLAVVGGNLTAEDVAEHIRKMLIEQMNSQTPVSHG